MSAQAIGVIGLGNMGAGIAATLARAGRTLVVWDAAEKARANFEGRNGIRVAAPDELARACDVILFVVPASPQIEACLQGPRGIADNAARDLVIVDLTTSDPAATKRIAAAMAKRGIAYLDAGMSGGKAGAEEGRLSLMVGGDAEAFAKVRPILAEIATAIYHLGPSGAGHTMKLVHQIMCHTNFLAACEALRLGERAGLDLGAMVEVVNASNGRSYASEVRFPRHITSGKWDGGSRVYNLHKDLTMAVDMARTLGGPHSFAETTLAYLQAAVEGGMADKDFTLLYRDFAKLAER